MKRRRREKKAKREAMDQIRVALTSGARSRTTRPVTTCPHANWERLPIVNCPRRIATPPRWGGRPCLYHPPAPETIYPIPAFTIPRFRAPIPQRATAVDVAITIYKWASAYALEGLAEVELEAHIDLVRGQLLKLSDEHLVDALRTMMSHVHHLVARIIQLTTAFQVASVLVGDPNPAAGASMHSLLKRWTDHPYANLSAYRRGSAPALSQ